MNTRLSKDEVGDYVSLLNSMINEGDGWWGRAESALMRLLTLSGVKLTPSGKYKYLDEYTWEYSE